MSEPQLLRTLQASSEAFPGGVWTLSKLRDVLALLLGVREQAEAVRYGDCLGDLLGPLLPRGANAIETTYDPTGIGWKDQDCHSGADNGRRHEFELNTDISLTPQHAS